MCIYTHALKTNSHRGGPGDVFGDFEDVEEGRAYSGGDAVTAAAARAIADAAVR